MARLYTGSYVLHLEERLFSQIAAAKREDRFSPTTVIVPTRALARRLQSVLAGRGPWVNVHFVTFFELSLRLLKAAGHEVRPPVPEAASLLMLRQVIECDLPRTEHTGYFLAFPGSLKRLLGLFSRFTSYRVTPPADAAGIEKTVFDAYRAFAERKRERGIRDAEDLIDDAARLLEAGSAIDVPPGVFLYGFYDLNPVQRDIVRLLDERCNVTILSVGGFSPAAEEFFEPTARFYRGICPAAEPAAPAPGEPEPAVTSIARELFSPPGTPRLEAGGVVTIMTASGVRGEAAAVALSILDLMESDPSLGWRDIAVTMRERTGYVGTLADAFADYSIPAFFDGGQPLSTLPEVRSFRVMVSALRHDLPRDDILSIVSSAAFAWPGLAGGEEDLVRGNAWLLADFARRYRVISGAREWERAFDGYRKDRASDDYPGDGGDENRADGRDEVTARYIRAVEPIVRGFLSSLADIPGEAPPSEYRDRLSALIDTYLRPPDYRSHGADTVHDILDTLTAVSSVVPRVSREECLAILEDAISRGSTPSPGDIDGVFVSDVMGTRLVPHRVVILMGVNEKVFPHVGRRDPFLADDTGAALGLPTAASRLMEDRTLFALTVACALNRIIISRQRSDDAGRAVSPSPFLADLASRIAVGGVEGSITAGPGVRDYPRITAGDRALSRHREQDVRAFLCLGWPDVGEIDAVRAVVTGIPFLAGGLTAVNERASDRPFARYDGLIGGAEGLVDTILPLSAQKLESYAACPFDFFMRYILSIPEEEIVEEELDAEPRVLGSIYHRILSRLLPLLVQKGWLGAAADPVAVGRLVDAHVTKETSGRLSGRIPALILQARMRHAARIVGRLVERERSAAVSGFVPAHYEVTFGPRWDGTLEYPALTLTIGPRTFACVGRIDRIDINGPDAAFSVVDYKRKKGAGSRRLMTDITAGRHFQLPIYLMAADDLIAKGRYRPAGGALIYLEAEDGDDDRQTLSGEEFAQAREAVMGHVGTVIEAIAAGRFTPAREDSCRFCAHGDLCRSESKAIGASRRKQTAERDGAADGDGDADEQ